MFLRQHPFSRRIYPITYPHFLNRFQLLDVNKQIDANCDNLFVNEVLCLGLIGQDCTTVAVVNSGDTCTSIAVNARTSLATLFANNPNVDANCDNIRPGEVRYR